MKAKILKLNIAGRPLAWITHELTRDHVVPVSRGGADTWENKNISGDQMEFLKGHAKNRADLLHNTN